MDLYTKVCHLVHAAHFKNGSTPEESFYVAVCKNIRRRIGPVELERFNRNTVKVTRQKYRTELLRGLVDRVGIGHVQMGRGWLWRDLPVIVVRLDGADYLIDGNRRVLHRTLTGEAITRAYVVELTGAAAIKNRYSGKRAFNYEARRAGAAWWKAENDAVEEMLRGLPPGATVLDVPVGTARYVAIYQRLGLRALGIDVSSDMLKVAMRNIKSAGYVREFELRKDDVMRLGDIGRFDAVVCTRFLNWLLPDEMARVMSLLTRTARKRLIVSIEIGKRKSDQGNQPHLRRDFDGAIGGEVERVIPIARNYSMVQIGTERGV